MRFIYLHLVLLCSCLITSHAAPIDLVWPTPMPMPKRGDSQSEYYQATASGDPASGGFGCVRNNGYKYHEGLDIRTLNKSRRGEALDTVSAAMEGVVRHINKLGGESGYGRYVVIEHLKQTPTVYTLYAHLASIASDLQVGKAIQKGQAIGIMGNTAGGYRIPRERSHLHFEIGLRLSDDFQAWYSWKKFGSPNQHGVWNGMNLMGLDAWDLIQSWQGGKVNSISDYISTIPSAVVVRIANAGTPDFIRRYPELLANESITGLRGGWEIHFNNTGLPIKWAPIPPTQVKDMRPNEVRVLWTNPDLIKQQRCRDLVDTKGRNNSVGKDLKSVLELLFRLR